MSIDLFVKSLERDTENLICRRKHYMRIISQDRTLDIPYNHYHLHMTSGKIYACTLSNEDAYIEIASYSSDYKALKVMEQIRNARIYQLCEEDSAEYYEMPLDEYIEEGGKSNKDVSA